MLGGGANGRQACCVLEAVRAMVCQLRRYLLLAASTLALASCLSPTLPLPPPDRPDVSAPDASGMVRIQGTAVPKAEVIAWNHANNVIAGQVTGDSAVYDFTIQGQTNDVIELWYHKGNDQSQSVSFKVPDAKP